MSTSVYLLLILLNLFEKNNFLSTSVSTLSMACTDFYQTTPGRGPCVSHA